MGRDRLDTIKGIPQKLQAFEDFLMSYPEWQGKVVLFQICLPPREARKVQKQKVQSTELELQELHALINEYVTIQTSFLNKNTTLNVVSLECQGLWVESTGGGARPILLPSII